MMLTEQEIKDAAQLLAECEKDLGYYLSLGQTVDLIADNRCNKESEWPLEKCREMARSLHATHGVGAFHMAQERARKE
jgi:hypothetical protein